MHGGFLENVLEAVVAFYAELAPGACLQLEVGFRGRRRFGRLGREEQEGDGEED
jgi:hypothetical protein